MSVFEQESFPPLFAALLHIYFGNLTLHDIADTAGISMENLQSLRQNPRFFRFVDTFKRELSQEIIEDILVNTYAAEDYDRLASDFSLFDELLQMQIRVPLFTQLRNIADFIKSKTRYKLPIDTSEHRLFLRLFSFFVLVEKYTPTLLSNALRDMEATARNVVWPALGLESRDVDCLLERSLLPRQERLQELKERLGALSHGQ